MLRFLVNQLKNVALTLRISILTIFIILFVIAMTTLITIFYINSSRSLSYVSRELINEVSSAVFQDMTNEFSHVVIEAEMAARLMHRNVIDENNFSQISEFILHTMEREMKTFPSIHSVYWSDEKGTVILAEKAENGTVTSETVTQENNGITREIISRDSEDHVVKTDIQKTDYDPRIRPWYIQVKQAEKTIVTDVYHYIFFKQPFWGVTIAAPVIEDGKFIGAFGINVRLDFLRKFIENIKISEHSISFIVAENGDLISFPYFPQYMNPTLKKIDDGGHPIIAASFAEYKKTRKNEFIFTIDHKNYLAAYKEIKFVPSTWFLGVVVPEDDFIGPLKRTNIITVIVGVIILILGIIIFSELITRAVRSLKLLIKETEKIKNFELEGDIQIKSRIKEIDYLASALRGMKKGLRSFEKYVPADLVRLLIDTGIDVKVGGNKQQLVVFFSDIENFTGIAETLDPNQLMKYTCDYFDELSKIITKENGTIDKYIGDAIMAFWGAPIPKPNPCYHAARAALLCQQRSRELNQQWQTQAMPPLITRIGIHLGDAIVGNLGSSERVNYTAIGDTINIASRLEACNKMYRTHIMVSEPVYHLIKDEFLLRFVDCVALKGKENALQVYELIAEKSAVLAFDLTAYQAMYMRGFSAYQQQQWDEAIDCFKQCAHLYPQDSLAPIFIARCTTLKNNPPQHWTGVWVVVHEK